jgi:Rha family phage regulatory protein
MKKQIQTKPNLEIIDGKVSTTSLDIAEKVEKEHKDVLKAIRNLECSQSFSRRNFAPISYKDGYNRPQKAFRITRDGFATGMWSLC